MATAEGAGGATPVAEELAAVVAEPSAVQPEVVGPGVVVQGALHAVGHGRVIGDPLDVRVAHAHVPADLVKYSVGYVVADGPGVDVEAGAVVVMLGRLDGVGVLPAVAAALEAGHHVVEVVPRANPVVAHLGEGDQGVRASGADGSAA